MDKSAAASTVSVTQGQSAKVNVSANISATSGKELPQGAEARAEVSSDKVRDAVSRINEYVQQTERTLDFKLDENSGKTVISVYDKASAELILLPWLIGACLYTRNYTRLGSRDKIQIKSLQAYHS